jgi:hypothetical protein
MPIRLYVVRIITKKKGYDRKYIIIIIIFTYLPVA